METKVNKAKGKDFTDISVPVKKYLIVSGLGFVALAAYAARLAWVYTTFGAFPLQGVIILLGLLIFLINVITSKCVYTLKEDEVEIIKKSIFKKKELHIPYDKIYGIHHFKNQLMKPARYRYTHHMYNQLDNREIWSLLYDIGDLEKIGRVMMTGSAAFWHEFSLILPDRVGIPQEEVIAHVYQSMREKLIASGKVSPELLKKLEEAEKEKEMTFEEGIEQLRQEGTDMGGEEYEVTLDDIKKKEGFVEEGEDEQEEDLTEEPNEENKK